MGMFNPENIPNLKFTEARYGYDGKLKKVYSETKQRWILVKMFNVRAQNMLRKMFPEKG
jgi:hypothetical protein